jgi:non-haem Fe2+, alpha-ketoglutarate-dependent halogenase
VTNSISETETLGLTDEQIESFKENGFLGPFDLYSEEEAPLIWNQAMIEMVASKNKPHNSTEINYDRHLDCETLSRQIAEPAIVRKLNSLMGDDIICWKTNIFPKAPGEAKTDWHQVQRHFISESGDLSYPSLRYTEDSTAATQELTVWTAFSEADKAHACLRFIPGSHKRWFYDETKPMARDVETKSDSFFGYDYSELRLDKNWNPNDQEIVDMELKPGQFVMFVAKCIHASYPNTADTKRVAFAGRYVSSSVRVYEDLDRIEGFGGSMDLDKHANVLVSGEDRNGHNRMYDTNLNGFPFKKVEIDRH